MEHDFELHNSKLGSKNKKDSTSSNILDIGNSYEIEKDNYSKTYAENQFEVGPKFIISYD